MSHGISMMNTSGRAFAGCIVTLVDLDTHQLRVEHVAGYQYQIGGRSYSRSTVHVGVEKVLRELLDRAEQWPGRWRVRTISTPETILSDLKGRDLKNQRQPWQLEAQMLGQIGRGDMLEPHR